MSDIISGFSGTTATQTGWISTFGDYAFAVVGTHGGGTTSLQFRTPGTSVGEYSAAVDIHEDASFTADGIVGVSLARGFQFRIASVPGTSTTRNVIAMLSATGIG